MAINIKHVLSELLKLHGLSEFKFSQQVNLPRATINRLTSFKILRQKYTDTQKVVTLFKLPCLL